jgi:hypothetical protein
MKRYIITLKNSKGQKYITAVDANDDDTALSIAYSRTKNLTFDFSDFVLEQMERVS